MPLQLESKIQLGGVRGRIDHMAADLSRQRVFVAELGNNSVSAIDLKAGQVAHRWPGLKEPQGVAYVPAVETLYAANGGDGSVRLFNGEGDAERGRIVLGSDALRRTEHSRLSCASPGVRARWTGRPLVSTTA